MPPEERDSAYVWDVREALRRVSSYIAGKTLHDLETEELLQDGVVRQLTIAGEASRRVSPVTCQRFPEVPWGDLVGLRNVVVHQYDRIDWPTLFTIATEEVPDLFAAVDKAAATLLEEAADADPA